MFIRNRCQLLFAIILLNTLCCVHSQQLTDAFSQHIKWFFTDPYNLLFKTKGAFLATHIGVLGVSGLLMLPEDEIRYFIRENYQKGAKSPFTYANYLGTNEAIGICGAGYGLILLSHNRKLHDAAFTSLQTVAYAEGLTNSYKYLIGRARPAQTNPETRGNQLVFDPLSGNSSFPSGHATIAFALVTPWFMYYPHWYTGLLFIGAAGTTIARMGLDRHWGSDVLAGAGIGFFTGYFLSKLHQNQEEDISILPVMSSESVGISLLYRY